MTVNENLRAAVQRVRREADESTRDDAMIFSVQAFREIQRRSEAGTDIHGIATKALLYLERKILGANGS